MGRRSLKDMFESEKLKMFEQQFINVISSRC